MLKFKTLTKAAQNQDISKFQDLINEYGQVIFDKLDLLKGTSNTENLYFLLLTNLWSEKENITEHISLFDDYIDFKLNSLKRVDVTLNLENLKISTQDQISYLNKLIISHISNDI